MDYYKYIWKVFQVVRKKNLSPSTFFNKSTKNGWIFKIQVSTCIKIKFWWGNFIEKFQILVISKSRKNQNPIGKNWVSMAEEIDSREL